MAAGEPAAAGAAATVGGLAVDSSVNSATGFGSGLNEKGLGRELGLGNGDRVGIENWIAWEI